MARSYSFGAVLVILASHCIAGCGRDASQLTNDPFDGLGGAVNDGSTNTTASESLDTQTVELERADQDLVLCAAVVDIITNPKLRELRQFYADESNIVVLRLSPKVAWPSPIILPEHIRIFVEKEGGLYGDKEALALCIAVRRIGKVEHADALNCSDVVLNVYGVGRRSDGVTVLGGADVCYRIVFRDCGGIDCELVGTVDF